ncbi:hypothetical protein [Rhizobium sp. Rhizsp42]|uniref:hypothetical protein n=1 Tax=Rhizobium sp. Rhizsp42 TaxID=3243034 RepID=UPI000DD5495D
MRSPWQVLKGFASRGKADGSPGHPDKAEDNGAQAPEKAQPRESKPRTNLTDPRSADTNTVSIRVNIAAEEPQAPLEERHATDDGPRIRPLQTEVSSKHEEEPMPRPVEVKASSTPLAPNPSRAAGHLDNKAPEKRTAHSGKKPNKVASVSHDASRSDEVAVVDQAIALDTEIHALRERLAEKLHAQNTHMRLLLERYDR